MTIDEVAKYLEINRTTIWKWENKGKITFTRYGKKPEADKHQVDDIKVKLDEEKRLKKLGHRKCTCCDKEDDKQNFKLNENLCKECDKKKHKEYYNNNKEKCKTATNKWKNKNIEKVKKHKKKHQDKIRHLMPSRHIKSRYGLNPEEYNKMLEDCEYRCEICGIKPNRLCVDHDHKTNKVRGILCNYCNLGIGLLKDDINIILYAIKYLSSNYKYNKKYVSWDKYKDIRELNNNKCNICNTTVNKMCIDHCHKTGLIRGLLCGSCNIAISRFYDNITLLENTLKYLERHQGQQNG